MLRGDVSYGFYKNKKVPYEQFVRKKIKPSEFLSYDKCTCCNNWAFVIPSELDITGKKTEHFLS